MAVEDLVEGDGIPCGCDAFGCTCSDDATVRLSSGMAICGCCFADCPDVHGPDGLTGLRQEMNRLRDDIAKDGGE